MNPEDIARFRDTLEQERRSLRAQLVEHGADPDNLSSLELDFERGFADSAQTTAERDRLLSVIENLRQTLGDVEHALEKINKGSGYGMCERCGNEIGRERLEALPWARLCISCKQGRR
ncbi:MAG TPA: TraR/DksA family transcriptional regulator [Actinomycetota bacterium]|nr:TraR/DksA family transcriptional regulator [Actinomycetota bacterium]